MYNIKVLISHASLAKELLLIPIVAAVEKGCILSLLMHLLLWLVGVETQDWTMTMSFIVLIDSEPDRAVIFKLLLCFVIIITYVIKFISEKWEFQSDKFVFSHEYNQWPDFPWYYVVTNFRWKVNTSRLITAVNHVLKGCWCKVYLSVNWWQWHMSPCGRNAPSCPPLPHQWMCARGRQGGARSSCRTQLLTDALVDAISNVGTIISGYISMSSQTLL